jgi:hypothetical protein
MGVRERSAGYELVAAAQTAQVLGPTGGPGDILERVIVNDNTGTITILDGAVTVLVIPALATGVIEVQATAVTNWNITTAAATSCMCVGEFT